MAARYITSTMLSDFGPYVSKLILELPAEVGTGDVSVNTFNVFCTRRLRDTGEVLMRKELGAAEALPSVGYVSVLACYPSDEKGARLSRADHVTLEVPEVRLDKCIEGTVLGSRYVDNDYRITLLQDLPQEGAPLSGLVFDERAADLCPQLDGWDFVSAAESPCGLGYGFFTPDFEKDGRSVSDGFGKVQSISEAGIPLVVWLHGAGEGGDDPRLACTGNYVTGLSDPLIQQRLGGVAWVLVPQSPTFWMDDGVEQLGRSNKSIYVDALARLIQEFIEVHAPRVDRDHVIIGGLSNGGFMTIRMLVDHPELFSAGIACCAPFYVENQTPEVISALRDKPLWFVHSKGDELVDPHQTSLPLYHRLVDAGAANAHFTLFDHVEDLTGTYHDQQGRPLHTFNHGVWIHVYRDFCTTELDGSKVMSHGEPVTMWEWAGQQSLEGEAHE